VEISSDHDREPSKDKKKTGMEKVMDECRKLLQIEWGYEGDANKRNDRYKKLHRSMLGSNPTVADLKYYDDIKTNKSSLINAITAKYGTGPREFCFHNPVSGVMIKLENSKEHSKLRDQCRENMWFGFENTVKEEDGALVWCKAVTNRGNSSSFHLCRFELTDLDRDHQIPLAMSTGTSFWTQKVENDRIYEDVCSIPLCQSRP